mmetsp:Transcript_98088/g.189406  ORF Transcript_98088/g.189406 Transcript_98088/m.189406 type:complete len:211 (-) Transcript_98088:1000-1632(-)
MRLLSIAEPRCLGRNATSVSSGFSVLASWSNLSGIQICWRLQVSKKSKKNFTTRKRVTAMPPVQRRWTHLWFLGQIPNRRRPSSWTPSIPFPRSATARCRPTPMRSLLPLRWLNRTRSKQPLLCGHCLSPISTAASMRSWPRKLLIQRTANTDATGAGLASRNSAVTRTSRTASVGLRCSVCRWQLASLATPRITQFKNHRSVTSESSVA